VGGVIIIVDYATQTAHKINTQNIKTIKHKKDKLLTLKWLQMNFMLYGVWLTATVRAVSR